MEEVERKLKGLLQTQTLKEEVQNLKVALGKTFPASRHVTHRVSRTNEGGEFPQKKAKPMHPQKVIKSALHLLDPAAQDCRRPLVWSSRIPSSPEQKSNTKGCTISRSRNRHHITIERHYRRNQLIANLRALFSS